MGDKAGVYAVLDRDTGATVWARQFPTGSHLGGIMTTASHNPVQYNGFKISGPKAKPIGAASGLDDIKRIARRPTTVAEHRFDWLDDRASERPEWIAAFLEMKTVWHPIGV